ncbi:HAD-IIIC family phosphatase [Phenylobacterium kunshanense]|uniref:FkbH domain-containing protein n=1 Tax=Phenylobacterium kunshanense TaxID=1445034 RepID=A0A328BGB4_9CAUL|nr:HAD-IIIC family phosphatase [Phenylobacterium kunshanense]RAK66542.1 FkbH domain-containing protein [Phenylobacterium kunshanense]
MFQFEDAKPKRPPTKVEAPQAAGSDAPAITHRALLAWAEHCVECAAPACYSSCDLFDPTPAGKCRRFEDGIVRNPGASAPDAPAAEVRFRRWGKLEAQGNAALMPADKVARDERLLTLATPLVAPIGRAIAKVTGQSRWATAMEALHKRINNRLQAKALAPAADAFLAEIINPGAQPVRLLLTAMIDKARLPRAVRSDQLPRTMTVAIEATPGFSRHEIPLDDMREILLSGLPFNLALTPADGDDAHLIFRRLDLVAFEKTSGAETGRADKVAPAKAAKLVVFDLDNTLWEGVLLEGEVKLRDGVHDLFRTLDERGILISVASKNAHDDAMSKLEALGLAEYVLHPRIGWGPKSEGLKKIVKAIDIGSDTVLFIDDNPFEREEVAGAAPEVEVLPETAISTLADHPRLQGAVTPESRTRRQMYREAIVREQAAESFGDDYLSFLRECGIHTEIRPDTPDDFERVVELVQRTNQLNFSGRKYSRDEIAEILADPNRERHVVICRDKFGSYGTVGFCLSRRETAPDGGEVVMIEDFMLSCRVQGKFIEQALFWRLAEDGVRPPAQSVIVNFKRTDRNRAAEMVLEKLGFATDVEGPLRLDIKPGDLAVDFLTVEGASAPAKPALETVE